MNLSTLLLDTDYMGMYLFIAAVPCLLLVAVEATFTALYLKKRKPVFFVLFLLLAAASVLWGLSLVETREPAFRPLGVLSLAAVALLFGANMWKMVRK